jgi:hypothetical protein
VKCKDFNVDFVLVSVLKPAIVNSRHDVVFKGAGNLQTSSSNKLCDKNNYFACFLQDMPQ